MKPGNPTERGMNILIVSATAQIAGGLINKIDQYGNILYLTGRDKKKLEEFSVNIRKAVCNLIELDFADDNYCDTLLRPINSLDGIIMFPGKFETVRVSKLHKYDIEEILKINYIVPAKLFSALLDAKKINKGASVVFISSLAVNNTWIGNSAYGSSKVALERFCKSAALECSGKKIRCNCIRCGYIESKLSHDINKDYIAQTLFRYPLGFGKVNDVAGLCLFLLSDDSEWITGQVIGLDGGFSIT